jgi:PAS domain S-box-containing protein
MDRIEIERFISFPESLELSEILKLYITLLNSTYNGIIATDRNANIIFVNKAAEEMIGVKYNEVLGVPLRAVVPEADVRGVIESGKKQTGQKVRLPNNRFVITNRSPIFFNGDTIGMVGVFQDISDIEAISNELESVKQMNRLLQKIIDSIYDGLAIADGKGYILSINSAFERIANVTSAEFVGKHANQLTQEGFVSKSVTMQVLETRKPANLSIKVKAGKDLFGGSYF